MHVAVVHSFSFCDAKVVYYDTIYVKLYNICNRNDRLHPWESSTSHKEINNK